MDEVKYKKSSNLKGPVYTLSKKEILSITYENGEKEDFSEEKAPQENIPAVSPQTIEVPVEENKVEMPTIKAGTPIPLRAVNTVSAGKVKVGDKVTFQVERDINVDSVTVLPYGTPVNGLIYEAKKSSAFGTKGRLGIRISDILLPDGRQMPVTEGNVYITGKNRTPLSVLLCLFITWPAMFITGSKAEMPAGYQTIVNAAGAITSMLQASVETEVERNQPSLGFAKITKKSGIIVDAEIVSLKDNILSYRKKSSSKEHHIKLLEVKEIKYKDGNVYVPQIENNDANPSFDNSIARQANIIKKNGLWIRNVYVNPESGGIISYKKNLTPSAKVYLIDKNLVREIQYKE